jgi:hypothetical protein
MMRGVILEINNAYLLTFKQSARFLGLSLSKFRALHLSGRGPSFIRIDGCLRCRVQDLEKFAIKHLVLVSE